MAIRSLQTRKVTGICITASHNPAPDDGVKLVEPNGEMLQQKYEYLANKLANASSDKDLVEIVERALEEENVSTDPEGCKVLIGRDTRPSGEALASDAAAGVMCLGVPVELVGVVTTPQLHWSVMRKNQSLDSSEEAYYAMLVDAFAVLVGPNMDITLHIDCANSRA